MEKETGRNILNVLRDNILVKEMTKEQLGAILLPEYMADDDWQRGKVVGVGPGLLIDGKRIPLDVKVGDIIVFPKMPGGGRHLTVGIAGEDFIIFNEKFVLGIES